MSATCPAEKTQHAASQRWQTRSPSKPRQNRTRTCPHTASAGRRRTYATWLLRRGAGTESVKERLGHASITTTVDTYGHLTIEDARATLEAAGWFTGTEVQL